ncbi:uncharacterized protein LOC105632913 [Jatropha curcas]|uniref:uncharacterized protein LOC105632913 n=1 Tax=Jatropha curcas TaxID=180498 RepID=UPI0009D63F09|nr:uncharacterized protein LOC105632913 [Jatropha curcas]
MGDQIESLEERLKSFLGHLKAEHGIFERIVYKNKNQHRRSSYFQYLLKVRRDLRLLQSAKLEELLTSCFHVITGKKPKQKVHLLESLKWGKCDGRMPNFMDRVLGAARLLSQMVEPMLKAATEILFDVVSVFNMVSSLSQKKQSVKITQEGIEVFREYYPSNKEFVTLECLWKRDKFILLERTHKSNTEAQDVDLGNASVKTSALLYKSIESFLGDDSDTENLKEDCTVEEGRIPCIKEDKKDLFAEPSIENENRMEVEGGVDVELRHNPADGGTTEEKLPPEGSLLSTSTSPSTAKTLTPKSVAKSVGFISIKRPATSEAAFISVKRPTASTASVTDLHFEEDEKDSSNKEDSFFNLLTGGNLKDSLF